MKTRYWILPLIVILGGCGGGGSGGSGQSGGPSFDISIVTDSSSVFDKKDPSWFSLYKTAPTNLNAVIQARLYQEVGYFTPPYQATANTVALYGTMNSFAQSISASIRPDLSGLWSVTEAHSVYVSDVRLTSSGNPFVEAICSVSDEYHSNVNNGQVFGFSGLPGVLYTVWKQSPSGDWGIAQSMMVACDPKAALICSDPPSPPLSFQ